MLTCQNCGNQFVPTTRAHKKYCSPKCGRNLYNKNNRAITVNKKLINPSKDFLYNKEKQNKKNQYNELLTTHYTIKNFFDKHGFEIVNLERFCKNELGFEIQPIVVAISCLGNKWNGGVTKFYPKSIDTYVEQYRNKSLDICSVKYITSNLNISEQTYWAYTKKYIGAPKRIIYRGKQTFDKKECDTWISYVKSQKLFEADLESINKETKLIRQDIKSYFYKIEQSSVKLVQRYKKQQRILEKQKRKELKLSIKHQKLTNKKFKTNSKQLPSNKTDGQFATQFITSIKSEFKNKTGVWLKLKPNEVWLLLGYTKNEFIQNIKSKMEPWMNWENNTYARSDIRTWHLDHVIPKSSFNYTSVQDEAFRKCWALNNLNPYEAIVNIVKGNSLKISERVFSVFRRCVIKGCDKTSSWDLFFSYSVEDARKHIKNNLLDGMNFSNYGKVWHLDHIIPQTALPYESREDENFKKCWALNNLKPLYIKENTSKSSKHNGKKYFLDVNF